MVSATETARKLFGVAIFDTTSFKQDNINIDDLNTELRLHIFQLNKKLEVEEAKIKLFQSLNLENENALEQKDLINAQLNAENQKLKKVFIFYFNKFVIFIYIHFLFLKNI